MLALAPPGAAHDPAGERRATGALAQDLLVEGLRLRLGLDAELAAEHAHAVLVVAQRRAAPTEIRVQPHQRAVHRLLQRVQRQQPQRRLHRGLRRTRPTLPREQLRESFERHLAQPLALPQQPLLERCFVHREPAEQIALVERRRPLQRRRRRLPHEALERRGVHLHRRRVQGQRVAVLPHRRDGADRLADREQRLAQARARRLLADAAPEQARELVARVRPAERQREIGEQRLGLAGGQGDRRARVEPGLKAAEERETEPRHGAAWAPTLPPFDATFNAGLDGS